jgi:hypothetical protein
MILNSLFGGGTTVPPLPPHIRGYPPGPPFYFVWLHSKVTKEDKLLKRFIAHKVTKEDKLLKRFIAHKGGPGVPPGYGGVTNHKVIR